MWLKITSFTKFRKKSESKSKKIRWCVHFAIFIHNIRNEKKDEYIGYYNRDYNQAENELVANFVTSARTNASIEIVEAIKGMTESERNPDIDLDTLVQLWKILIPNLI